jgi:hypothetical protein
MPAGTQWHAIAPKQWRIPAKTEKNCPDALWHLKQTGNKEDPIRIEIEQIFSFDYKYNRDEKR